MSNDTVTRKVWILDREYCISAPQDEQDRVQEASKYLDDTLRGIKKNGKILGIERMMVLAALNITAELLQLKQEHTQQTQALTTQSSQWLQDLECALNKTNSVKQDDCT